MRTALSLLVCSLVIVTACDGERPRGPAPDAAPDGATGGGDTSPPDAGLDATLDACIAECGPRECGDDGCGGSCGECSDAGTCGPDGMCEAPALPCPPVGPFGTDIGDIAPDLTLMDCDGVEHSLHDLCEAPVSWVFQYAEWCPLCQDFAPTIQSLYERHLPDGLAAFLVISEDGDFGPADAALCAEVRERYGLTMPVLYDPAGQLTSTLDIRSNDYNVLMTRGNRLRYKVHYSDRTMEGELAAAFAEAPSP